MPEAPAHAESALATEVRRGVSLLAAEYPHWRAALLPEGTGFPSLPLAELLAGDAPFLYASLEPCQPTERGPWSGPPGTMLNVLLGVPMARLGQGASGLGRAQQDFPLTLWPLQLPLALCLRLRLFGWAADPGWPNDVFIAGKKVAGVFCRRAEGWLLVYACVNVLQQEEDFPQGARGRHAPTSLALAPRRLPAAEELEPAEVAPSVLQCLVAVLESPWDRARMLEQYRNACVTLGTRVALRLFAGEGIAGMAWGIQADGALRVELLGGRTIEVPPPLEEGLPPMNVEPVVESLPTPPGPAPLTQAQSRARLLAFGALILGLATFFVSTGLYLRPRIQAMAGPLHVKVVNESPDRLRADLIFEARPTTLEMDPGEFGTIRFTPHREEGLGVRVFARNLPTASTDAGPFLPNQRVDVVVRLKSASEVIVEQKPAATP